MLTAAEIQEHCLVMLYDLPARERDSAVWVMSPAMWMDVRRAADSRGCPVWEPSRSADGPHLLLGKPVTLREGALGITLEQA